MQFVKDTYPIKPYSDQTIGVLLMNDCYNKLDHFLPIFFLDFNTDNAIVLSSKFPHGDVLPHNIVWNKEKKLTLIDIDGGVAPSQMMLERKINYTEEKKNGWYAALSYPNGARKKPEAYTKIQLMALLEYLSQKETISENFLYIS